MWLSGQHKRPADCGEGQTGIVTVGGSEAAVQLDSERRGLEVYAPAGYYWTPEVDQRVLVIRGPGEIPCIVGVRQDSEYPYSVGIRANVVEVSGRDVSVQAGESANISAKAVKMSGKDVSVQAEESVGIHANAVKVSGQDVSVQAGESAGISANAVEMSGRNVSVRAEGDAVVAGKTVDLQGEVLINGEPLEEVIKRILGKLL